MCLHAVEEAIKAAEKRQAETQRGEDRRPPTPDWIIELGIGVGARPVYVHVGHCYSIGRRHRSITRAQALAALADGVDPCIHCRPDTELRVL